MVVQVGIKKKKKKMLILRFHQKLNLIYPKKKNLV